MPRFDGTSNGDRETIKQWLEQFELVAGACRWDDAAKLVKFLVTRLKGQAYTFYQSCTPQQCTSYTALTAALTKKFTPVRIQRADKPVSPEKTG